MGKVQNSKIIGLEIEKEELKERVAVLEEEKANLKSELDHLQDLHARLVKRRDREAKKTNLAVSALSDKVNRLTLKTSLDNISFDGRAYFLTHEKLKGDFRNQFGVPEFPKRLSKVKGKSGLEGYFPICPHILICNIVESFSVLLSHPMLGRYEDLQMTLTEFLRRPIFDCPNEICPCFSKCRSLVTKELLGEGERHCKITKEF